MPLLRRALAAAGTLIVVLGIGVTGSASAAQAATGTSTRPPLRCLTWWMQTALISMLLGTADPRAASASRVRGGSRRGPTARCGSPTAARSGGSRTTRDGHHLHRPQHRQLGTGSRPVRTGRCGSPTPATTRSGGSPPPGWSPTTPTPASRTRRASRPGRTVRCGSPTTADNSIGRITTAGNGHQLHRPRHRRPVGITAGPDGALWFTNSRRTTRSGGSPPAGR